MNNYSIYDFHISDLRDKNISGKNNTEINKLFFQIINSYLKDNMKILDIGTGNGYVLKEISEETTKKIHLYGNDNSEAMLKKAKENCNSTTQKRTAHPIQGGAMRLLLFIAFLMENNIIVLWQHRTIPA